MKLCFLITAIFISSVCFAQSRAADTGCVYEYDLSKWSIHNFDDTVWLSLNTGKEIFLLSNRVYLNGKKIYRFKEVFTFEQLMLAVRDKTYYLYGFTSRKNNFGPYVQLSPYGTLLKITTGNRVTKTENLSFIEPGELCAFIAKQVKD